MAVKIYKEPVPKSVLKYLLFLFLQPDAQIATPDQLFPRGLNHASNGAVIVEDQGLVSITQKPAIITCLKVQTCKCSQVDGWKQVGLQNLTL
ncbi:MAG: hypothetical protein JJV98_12050 [Desulfosarcina sp.]|nr:hypothetical protein [Desulfobacterales bacterium]